MKDMSIQINLRAVRERAGLSLSRAAEITGVSKAMLGQIERGESSPTIATLWKLAKGFHLPLTAFIEDVVRTPDALVPASEPVRPERLLGDLAVRTVFPFDPVYGSETFVVTLAPGQIHDSVPHDVGVVEEIFVSEGDMDLRLDGVWTTHRSGDGMRFRADRPHGYRNLAATPARFLNTIHYPRTALFGGTPSAE